KADGARVEHERRRPRPRRGYRSIAASRGNARPQVPRPARRHRPLPHPPRRINEAPKAARSPPRPPNLNSRQKYPSPPLLGEKVPQADEGAVHLAKTKPLA